MKKFLSLVLCLCMLVCCVPAAMAAAADGTYEVETTGNADGLKLSVTFADGKITDVTVVSHNETAGVCDPAIERVPAEIVEANSVAVDTVSGATNTSNGIINGVKAAIEMAGGDVADYETASAASAERTDVTYETDLVVADAGIAGLTTAVTAAEAGMKVILIEKNATVGGSLALAGGNFCSVNSPITEAYGVKDDLETTLAYWNWTSENSLNKDSKYPDMDRVTLLLNKSADLIQWMTDHGVPYYKATDVGERTVSKIYTDGKGAKVASVLEQCAINAGVTVMTETPAVELITENGVVTGIKAQSAAENITIKAKNVMLATGGFGSNPEMLAELVPGFADAVAYSASGNTGDGLVMAQAVGAKLYEDPWAMSSANLDPAIISAVSDVSTMQSYTYYNNRMLVNEKGDRFTNEYVGNAYALIANEIANQECKTWYIVDSTDEAMNPLYEEGAAAGVIAKGETIEELGEALGIDAAELKSSFDAYQAICAAGEDTAFGKPAEYLTAYAENGPYYAIRFKPGLLGTMGGVETDTNGHVLDENGNVIEGLYAAGEMSNRSFYNQVYIGSASLTLYPISAQLAVADMLAK